MSKLLKLTNTDATFGGNPIVLNLDNIITIKPSATNDNCFVIRTNSKGNGGTGSTTGIGLFTITGDTYYNFAKEINSAITAAPGSSVIKLHTKAKIDNYTISN
jgi:hypothetical protein